MVEVGGKLMAENGCKKITADGELIEVLEMLEEKVKHATWDGMGKISTRVLTKILARKIKSSKMF